MPILATRIIFIVKLIKTVRKLIKIKGLVRFDIESPGVNRYRLAKIEPNTRTGITSDAPVNALPISNPMSSLENRNA